MREHGGNLSDRSRTTSVLYPSRRLVCRDYGAAGHRPAVRLVDCIGLRDLSGHRPQYLGRVRGTWTGADLRPDDRTVACLAANHGQALGKAPSAQAPVEGLSARRTPAPP
jgi:hypothetical protein